MFSEVFRGTTVAMLLAFAVYIASSVITPILSALYGTVARATPIWAASSLTGLLMSEVITPLSSNGLPPVDTEALYEAALIVAVYAVVFVIIAAIRLIKSDVTKKTD
jgi:ABC-type transport system involved in multi-copper enzyme maturation permease subunit